MGRITDKVVVITGGASGIGAAAAEKLLGEGAYVVLGDIQEQAGDCLLYTSDAADES